MTRKPRYLMGNMAHAALLGALLLGNTAYAQLPPEVEADRLLLLARDSMEANNWKAAREAFEGILALGIEVPPDFHYFYARALDKSGQTKKARDRLAQYLESADRSSENYREALALYNEVETRIKRREEQVKEKNRDDLRKQRAEAEAGDVEAQYMLGMEYTFGFITEKNYPEALKWYQRAAAQNHAKAMFYIGMMYAAGAGVERNLETTFSWYRKSAELGHDRGQKAVGDGYMHGIKDVVEQNYAEAMKWYQLAAAQGNASAMAMIASIYYHGYGVEKNEVTSLAWYRKSAEAGDSYGILNLAEFYQYGRAGLQQDKAKALELYQKAVRNGITPTETEQVTQQIIKELQAELAQH